MATPKVFTDADVSNVFAEAYLNKFLAAGDADKVQCKQWWARIAYNGSAWEVVSTTDSAGLDSGDLAWNGTAYQVEITLSGFTAAPLVVATPPASDSAYDVRAHASDSATVVVAFSSAGVRVETEETDMDVCLLIVGV